MVAKRQYRRAGYELGIRRRSELRLADYPFADLGGRRVIFSWECAGLHEVEGRWSIDHAEQRSLEEVAWMM